MNAIKPLDPASEHGQRIAADLTSALAAIELAIAERHRDEQQHIPAEQQQAA